MKKLLFGILAVFGSTAAFTQSSELGILAGASNYHGDLAQEIVWKESNLSGGVFYKYNFNEYWALRPTISYLKISGSDQNFKETKTRNLSFSSEIYEVGALMEFNYQPFSNSARHDRLTFYALMGAGAMIHEPTAILNGETYKLRKLRTEGVKYSKLQLVIPVGGGVKYALSKNIIVGVEVGFRKTFTDYLDDVSSVYPNQNSLSEQAALLSDRSGELTESQIPLATPGQMRGDPNLKDWYFQSALTLSYRFTPIKCWPMR